MYSYLGKKINCIGITSRASTSRTRIKNFKHRDLFDFDWPKSDREALIDNKTKTR